MKAALLSLFLLISLASCSKEETTYHPIANKLPGEWENDTGAVYHFMQPQDSMVYITWNGSQVKQYKFYIEPSTTELKYWGAGPGGASKWLNGGKLNINDTYTKMTFINEELEKK